MDVGSAMMAVRTAGRLSPAGDGAGAQRLAPLVEAGVDDLLRGLGLTGLRTGRRPLRRLLRPLAARIARPVGAFDELVGECGLGPAGAWLAGELGCGLRIVGRASVPRTGPVLILANHPGLLDTVALFAAIDRPDLRIVAADRPFLRAMPNTLARLCTVGGPEQGSLAGMRELVRHRRAGGAILSFPAGAIEGDPAALPVDTPAGWHAGIEGLLRLTGAVPIVPAVVSGVLSPRALRHPLARIRTAGPDRQWLAALLQLLVPRLQDVMVEVRFGETIGAAGDRAALARAIVTAVRRLVARAGETGADAG